jgi:tellurite resistance protein TehA-like permease
MNKPVIISALLLLPALLIISGFYFNKEILYSIGFVVLIFFIIMAIRGKFGSTNKKE